MSARPGPEVLAPSRWVGAAVKRVEDPRLLTGRGRYLDDLGPAGLLHAAFVRSPHAHARVVRVDAEAARAVPGVVAVLAGRDLTDVGALAPRLTAAGFAPTAWAPLAPARVRFAGEPVAVVAARSAYVAADAAELVGVEYEPRPALAGIDAALAAGAPALHEGVDGNVLARQAQQRGDVAGAFARAAHVVRETFDHGRVSASPLEPRGVVGPLGGRRPHGLGGHPGARSCCVPSSRVSWACPRAASGWWPRTRAEASARRCMCCRRISRWRSSPARPGGP